jgi:Leucine-rich repeat (LRR) protein
LARSAENGQPLVVLGEAGGGKTTILRWAACHAVTRQLESDPSTPFSSLRRERFEPGLADARDPEEQPRLAWWARVPLLLRLREVQDGVLPREDAWPGKSAGLPRDPPLDWLDEILGGGHGLVLLDGLDELGSTGRDLARDTLRSILRDRRGNLVVVTSRPGAFEADWFEGVPLQLATIRAMSPTQRETCIANWHEAVAQAKPAEAAQTRMLGEELTQKIRISPYLQEPTTNPLICAATCALHHGRNGYLPSGLVDLFDALCKMLIHERDQQQGLIDQAHVPEAYRRLDLGHKRQLLEEIAAEMVLNRQSQRSDADTLVSVRERLSGIPEHRNAPPKDILKGLLLRSGLLRPSGDNAVDFLHNAFKEYLAAARFLARRSQAYLIEAADRDPGDRVFAYAYAIASARGEETLTKELVEGLLDRAAPDQDTQRHREILGIRCRGVTVSAAGSILDRFDLLIDQVVPPRDTQEAEAIATLGGEVIERLRQPDEAPEIAAACAHALVTIGTTSARDALEAFKATGHQIVAAELAFAFNPLELPYWQSRVKKEPEQWPTEQALPDAIATQVTDLVPLKSLTDALELYLDGVAAVDLTPLKDLSGLQTLSLDDTAVVDLTPLSGLASLRYLSLDNTAVADLTPLKGLSSLRTLDLKDTAVADLTPLAGLTGLQWLGLVNTAVADLTPLKGLVGLQKLFLSNTAVADLTQLEGLAGLKTLFLDNTAVADLTPLSGLAGLQSLILHDTAVADLTPLSDLAGLQTLFLDNTAVADLTPLSGLVCLQWLTLDNTAVANLTPLRDLSGLQKLYLFDTSVADLTPVKQIKGLEIYGP